MLKNTSTKPKLDATDLRIIRALQKDARLSSAELAERVALTPSPCWRRVKQLEEGGVITGYHAAVDVEKLGYTATMFVFIALERSDAKGVRTFEAAVKKLPEVLACYRVSGKYDYQLFIAATDLKSYGDYAVDSINGLPLVKEVYTSFVLREVKAPVAPAV